jgi:hypothetical protein
VTRDGRAATLADAVRAQLGESTRQRLGEGYGRDPAPVLASASPVRSAVALDTLAQHPELSHNPDRYNREAAAQRSLDALADAVLRTGGRAANWGDGPTFAERAERLSGTAALASYGDGLGGSQVGLTAARTSHLEV